MRLLKDKNRLILYLGLILSFTFLIVAVLMILLYGISWDIDDPNFGVEKDKGDLLSHIKTNFSNTGLDQNQIYPWKEIYLWFAIVVVLIISFVNLIMGIFIKNKLRKTSTIISLVITLAGIILTNVELGFMSTDVDYCFSSHLNPSQAYPDKTMMAVNFVILDILGVLALVPPSFLVFKSLIN